MISSNTYFKEYQIKNGTDTTSQKYGEHPFLLYEEQSMYMSIA